MASTGLVYGVDLMHPALEGDPTAPTAAYPASKAAAEKELRESGLTWSVLRFGFVYGDGDGHLESLPRLAPRFNWHPAAAMSLIHHRDIATVVDLAFSGAIDGHIVNVTDEAPTTVYELANLIGSQLDESGEPLPNRWSGRMDGTLARRLGFQPTVPTVHQAVRDGIL